MILDWLRKLWPRRSPEVADISRQLRERAQIAEVERHLIKRDRESGQFARDMTLGVYQHHPKARQ